MLQRVNQSIPDGLMKLGKQARSKLDQERNEINRFKPICDFLFMHGHGEHEINCDYRHNIVPFDLVNQQFNGVMRLNILKVISPTEYIVWPIKSKSNGWHRINDSDNYLIFNVEFQKHHEDVKKQVVHHPVGLGDLAVYYRDGKPFRCEVIKIHEK